MKNILLCGVGGQGTVLASKLIAQAAMNMGLEARSAETIGMAQRGGSVVSHVRFGDVIASPLIPTGCADVIIGFEPGEAVRVLPYLKKDGVVIVSPKPVKPVTATLSESNYDGVKELEYLKQNANRVIVVDGEDACRVCGSSKVLNITLLGAAVASGELGISMEQMEDALVQRVPERFIEMNRSALHYQEEK